MNNIWNPGIQSGLSVGSLPPPPCWALSTLLFPIFNPFLLGEGPAISHFKMKKSRLEEINYLWLQALWALKRWAGDEPRAVFEYSPPCWMFVVEGPAGQTFLHPS